MQREDYRKRQIDDGLIQANKGKKGPNFRFPPVIEELKAPEIGHIGAAEDSTHINDYSEVTDIQFVNRTGLPVKFTHSVLKLNLQDCRDTD